jgi:hypothetical protein
MNNNDWKEKVILCILQVATGISFKQSVFQKHMHKYHLFNGGKGIFKNLLCVNFFCSTINHRLPIVFVDFFLIDM